MTNLARSSLALVLPALFGAPKSCTLVNLFMICPRWSAGRQRPNSAPDGQQGWPLNYIVSQQINVGVAMPYRAGRVIGKFGMVKRNRGPFSGVSSSMATTQRLGAS
jgi:hypothetical protein